MHLPSSLLQLPHLNSIYLLKCPKLVELPTKEFEILPKLVELPIPPKESENLSVEDRKGLLDFLVAHNYFSNLYALCLSNTGIVSLPACIKRFVILRELDLMDCKQLQEIPELPPNISHIYASGCVSLESFPRVTKEFQFDRSALPASDWIDLSGCHKMLGNQEADSLLDQVANSLLDQVHVKDYFGGGIIFPGNTIPDSLSHRMDCSYSSSCKIDISGDWENEDEIKGIVCCVIEPILGISSCVFPEYGHFRICNDERTRDIKVLESDHVWMEYFILKHSSEVMGDTLQVEISLSSLSGLYIKSCGIHLIHRHEEKAKYHPRVDFNFHLDYPDVMFFMFRDRHAFYRTKRILDGSQPSKRRCDEGDDDDDCNLESSWEKMKAKIESLLEEIFSDFRFSVLVNSENDKWDV